MTCCDIWEVFDEPNNLIKEYKYWKLLVRKNNTKLGSCVAVTKRHLEALSEITPEEMQEFAQVVKEVEKSAKTAFNYDKINYLMLMMKDKHTHFHIFPRYNTERNFAGIKWLDEGGNDPLIQKRDELSQEVLNQIKEELKKNL